MALYPFDPIGNLPSNRVIETHTIDSVNGIQNNFLIPDAAPFYGESLVLVEVETGKILERGTDYELTHLFETAKEEVGKSIYGSVTLIDKTLVGEYRIVLQSLGGVFTNPDTQALRNGLDALSNLRQISWEEIANVDDLTFPPTPHTHPVTDIEAITEIINSVNAMTNAIKSGSRNINFTDIVDLDSKLIAPLLSKLDGITTAIDNKSSDTSNHWLTKSAPTARSSIGQIAAGEWKEIPLQLETLKAGSYLLNWDIQLEVNNVFYNDFNVRILIDGNPNARYGYNKGGIIPLDKGKIITVEIMLRDTGGEVVFADESFTSTLSLIRLGL